MNADDFRKSALSLPGTVESSHMSHPDFRIGGKIFASLGAPDQDWGMVKLTPQQQLSFMDACPAVFTPCNGAWGRGGCTNVRLSRASKGIVKNALQVAFDNIAEAERKHKPARQRSTISRGEPRGPSAAARDKVRRKALQLMRSLPEAIATPCGDGHLSFEVRGKRFGYLLVDHHGDGRLAINVKAAPGVSRKRTKEHPDRFHVPKYLGRHGWLGVWLDLPETDWAEVATVIKDAYRLAAPKSLSRS